MNFNTETHLTNFLAYAAKMAAEGCDRVGVDDYFTEFNLGTLAKTGKQRTALTAAVVDYIREGKARGAVSELVIYEARYSYAFCVYIMPKFEVTTEGLILQGHVLVLIHRLQQYFRNNKSRSHNSLEKVLARLNIECSPSTTAIILNMLDKAPNLPDIIGAAVSVHGELFVLSASR